MSASPPVSGSPPEWLATTRDAVRALVIEGIHELALDDRSRQAMKMALKMLDVMWDRLEDQRESMSRQTRWYTEFFDNAPDAYIITDAAGAVRETNRAAAEILGTSKENLAGRRLSDFVVQEQRAFFIQGLAAPLLQGRTRMLTSQATLRSLSGKGVRVLIKVRSIPQRDSATSGLCWLLRPMALLEAGVRSRG